MRCLALMCLLVAGQAFALDRLDEQAVKALVDRQALMIMHKDIDPLMALYDPAFHQIIPAENNRVLDRDGVRKIWNANFAIAKMILSTVDLRQVTVREDGQHAVARAHYRNRYLIQLKDSQKLIEQEDDFITEIALRNGEAVFVSMEKL